MSEDHDRTTSRPTSLHLSMRPLSSHRLDENRTSPWAAFGWSMIALAAAAVLFVVLIVLVFLNAGPPPVP